jgi:hypothetical protein
VSVFRRTRPPWRRCPKDRCARVVLEAVDAFEGLREIRLCNLDEATARIFYEEAERFRSPRGPAQPGGRA